MIDLLLSMTLLTAFLGGVTASLAPSYLSAMLPTCSTWASHHRTRNPAMALPFVGAATVTVSIALSASVLGRPLSVRYSPLFAIGGAVMVAMGTAMPLDWRMKLPMPGLSPQSDKGATSRYPSAVVSGVAMVSGTAASFPAAPASIHCLQGPFPEHSTKERL